MTTPRPRATFGWIVYDLANTIFALGVVGLYFPEWMTARGLVDSNLAVTQAAAGAVVIFAAPWIGARTDHSGARLPVLAGTTAIAVTATALLTRGPDWITFVVLGVALVSLNVGSVVYDALLPAVSTPATRGRVSGTGVGVGYLGSFIGLGIGILSFDVLGWSHAGTFTAMAVAFAVFSIPTFAFVRDTPAGPRAGAPPPLRRVVGSLVDSWRKASHHPNVIRFLLGRFLYTDAINTLIGGFLVIFAIEELGLEREGSELLLGLAIGGAIVGGLVGGRVIEHRGAKRTLRLVLLAWVVTIVAAVVAAWTATPEAVVPIGLVGGGALGATWASDRVVMMQVSPPAHLGEFYGLYATVGRFATILGPLVWALVVDVAGWGRSVAMLVLAGFVGSGWWVLRSVDDSSPHALDESNEAAGP